jgi:radical SAM superfamily enzyme YgiQ (UPF0313 family)
MERLAAADLVAIAVPMHTALRLGISVGREVKRRRPAATLCYYGLYAPLHAAHLRRAGADVILGGETEEALVAVAAALKEGRPPPEIPPTLKRLAFLPPERGPLPPLEAYARLLVGDERRLAGYLEATRGCRHLCRHCPIPSVYAGRFFAVPVDVVLEDARRQVAAGARHLTLGDPDFLNAPKHAMAVARGLHAAHPEVTFDVTIKVEHIVAHPELFPELAALGCAFVVSAYEALSDSILAILDKGHTVAEAHRALAIVRAAGLSLRPTFVPFTPWTTLDDYRALVRFIDEHQLHDEVDPIQLSLRLLVPPGSLLLDRPELRPHLGELDEERLTWSWRHPDPAMDALQLEIAALVEEAIQAPPRAAFARIAERVGVPARRASDRRAPPPRLSEPWFC